MHSALHILSISSTCRSYKNKADPQLMSFWSLHKIQGKHMYPGTFASGQLYSKQDSISVSGANQCHAPLSELIALCLISQAIVIQAGACKQRVLAFELSCSKTGDAVVTESLQPSHHSKLHRQQQERVATMGSPLRISAVCVLVMSWPCLYEASQLVHELVGTHDSPSRPVACS